ncbi:MAG: class I tRNA ligase family protein [Chloroflexi bacterium]|nr:class I tRNA ligase family protein [Chloroflexota bacterium]
MSKTKGNVVNPLAVMDEYGTDALRFAMVTGSTPGNDMRISTEKLQGSRNFANKIWNATRFIVGSADLGSVPDLEEGRRRSIESAHLDMADRWILSRQNDLITGVTRLMQDFQIGEAGRLIHEFLWSELADWYLEAIKGRLYGEDKQAKETASLVVATVMERTMRLLHPFMPFITEELWQNLPHEGDSIMVSSWPEAWATDEEAESEFGLVMDVVRAVRNARAEAGVEPARWIEAEIVAGEHTGMLRGQADIISRLGRIAADHLRIVESREAPYPKAISLVVGDVIAYLPLAGLVDVAAELSRLSRELEETRNAIARSEELLARPGFVDRAPANVVDKEKQKLETNREKARRLEERIDSLS